MKLARKNISLHCYDGHFQSASIAEYKPYI